MQAAILDLERVLTVQRTAKPLLRPSGVIISVLAAPMPPYTDDVLSGRCGVSGSWTDHPIRDPFPYPFLVVAKFIFWAFWDCWKSCSWS